MKLGLEKVKLFYTRTLFRNR